MVENLTFEKIHLFIVEDFKGAWDSVAANPDPKIGRGNFMFARQAMNLLEFASILCTGDPSDAALQTFSTELRKIEAKYFTELPGSCSLTKDFILPHTSSSIGSSLLDALFDLVRHGLAHQYQQTIVTLTDGNHFYVSITGPDHGQYLSTFKSQRPPKHLAYTFDNDGDMNLIIYPQILFLDFEKAIDKSHVLKNNYPFPYLSRPSSRSSSKRKGPGNYYNFNILSLESSFVAGNHMKF
jgi:hypothetical protein